MSFLFTSESVTEGHPDKIADQISDAVLDAILKADKNSKVACEVFTTTNFVLIGGEVKTTAHVDYEQIARDVLKKIGYDNEEIGIDYQTCEVKVLIHEQSPDINQSVEKDNGLLGAGDQGIMFGYATQESKSLMPFAIDYAHMISKKLTDVRKSNVLPYLRPDGKTQVTIEYNEDYSLKRIDTILISTQHDEDVDNAQISQDLKTHVIDPIIEPQYIDADTKIIINPSGKFVIGGPHGDAGLTGRKIIVDTYGGSCAHGGGAFSGKDCSKVDRSASYISRKIAKNIVAADLATRCQVQLSYGIGLEQPLSIYIETFGTNKVAVNSILQCVKDNFDLSPQGIIKELDLLQPIFSDSTVYGHFGKPYLPWEKLDKVEKFAQLLEN